MAPASDRLERSSVVALVAMALAVFVVANDVTALSVALPAIESDLDADVGTAQWVISAYALIFGVLIVPGGRLPTWWAGAGSSSPGRRSSPRSRCWAGSPPMRGC
jgi:MFS family permease